ncbi:MAG: glycosyltransferase family 4 protein [Halanaerobium sp.]
MKVLLINHFPLEGSGSGVYTKNIAQRLIDKGHQVKVVVVDNEINDSYQFPVETIIDYNFPCFTTHPKSNNQFYKLTRQEMNDYLNKFIRTIQKISQNFKPDIIHCQHLWVAPYAALQTNIPYVITAHGTDIKGYKKDKRYRQIALKGTAGAEKIITISDQVNQDVKKYYFNKDNKLVKILNGVDDNLFKPLETDRLKLIQKYLPEIKENPDYLITFVGKLTDFKGVDLLIKAAKKYEREFPNTMTLIIGHGELLDKLKAQVEKLNLKNIHFLGNLPQDDLPAFYSSADLSIVPSRVEPFGLVAVEALACGTPVIASRAGGLPDFINQDVGRLFKMNDSDDLAAKIIAALKNNDKEKKGKRAAEYALNKFSWARVIDEVLAVYNSVLSGEES